MTQDDDRVKRAVEREDPFADLTAIDRQHLLIIVAEIRRQDRLKPQKPAKAQLHLVKKKKSA